MKFNFKHILFLGIAGLLSIGVGQAQEKSSQKSSAQEGEIVMSQAQLDTFLHKLAEKRKAVLAKRKEEQKEVEDLKMDRLKDRQRMLEEEAGRMGYYPEPSRSSKEGGSYYEERLLYEMSRTNERIDRLYEIMMSGTTRSTAPAYSGGGQPSIIYEQQQQPAIAPQPEELTPSAESTPTKKERTVKKTPQSQFMATDTTGKREIDSLQSRINSMDEKMRVLDKLGETTGSSDYEKESQELRDQIERLNQELEEKQRALDEKNELSAALAKFEDYSQIVYFANNSAELSGNDKDKLKDVVKTVEENKPHLTAVLHGFSSSSGSAEYNEKLAFRRADAVKKVLLDAGLSSKDLIIQNHGVDASGSADKARRVEVNLIIN